MPTEENEIVKKGTAKMPMLEALGLENIQIRLIPAKMLYECYLTQRKININLFELQEMGIFMEADKGYMCRLLNGDDKKCYTCISESIQLEKE